MSENLNLVRSIYADWERGADEYRDLDDERVLVLGHYKGHAS
jgi:hypothetical protein